MIGVENSEEGQIVDYDQMIRIVNLQQLNAQIDIIYLPSQKTTLTSALLGTFWRALSPPEPTSCTSHNDRKSIYDHTSAPIHAILSYDLCASHNDRKSISRTRLNPQTLDVMERFHQLPEVTRS